MTKTLVPPPYSDPFNCSPMLTAQFVSVVSKLPHQNHTGKFIKITTDGWAPLQTEEIIGWGVCQMPGMWVNKLTKGQNHRPTVKT